MIQSELGSLSPLRGILLLSVPAHAPSPVTPAHLTLQSVVSLEGRPNKSRAGRFLILGLAHVAMRCTCAGMWDRLICAVSKDYKAGAAWSLLRCPSLGDGVFTLDCCFSRRLPVCRLKTTRARHASGGAEGEARMVRRPQRLG